MPVKRRRSQFDETPQTATDVKSSSDGAAAGDAMVVDSSTGRGGQKMPTTASGASAAPTASTGASAAAAPIAADRILLHLLETNRIRTLRTVDWRRQQKSIHTEHARRAIAPRLVKAIQSCTSLDRIELSVLCHPLTLRQALAALVSTCLCVEMHVRSL